MSSRTSEKNLARLLRKVTGGEWLSRLILYIVPLNGFEAAREQVVRLYREVYLELDEVEGAFSGKTHTEIQKWAIRPNSKIPEYDPHETVTTLLSLPNRLLEFIRRILIVALLLGTLFSVGLLRSLSRNGFTLIETVLALIPLPIIGVGILYLWSLYADTFAHQTLAEELRVGRMEVATRRRPQVVAYGIWNRSLLGQAGLLLIGIFYLLDSLPELPFVGQWFDDPVEGVTEIVVKNAEIAYHADGLVSAIRSLYRQNL